MVGWTWSSYLYFFVFLGELQPSPPFRYPPLRCANPSAATTLLLLLLVLLPPFLLLLRVTYKQFACFKNALDMALCSAFVLLWLWLWPLVLIVAVNYDSTWFGSAWTRVESSRRDCVLGAARCWGTYLSAYLKINVNSFIYFLCQIKRFKGYMQDIPSWGSILSLSLCPPPTSHLPSADYAPL